MRKSVLFSFLFITAFARAQGDRITITDVQITSGGGGGTSIYGDISDFRSLAPNSEILRKDFSGFDSRRTMTEGGGSMFQSFQLGFKLPKSTSSALRAGITHVAQNNLMSSNGYRSESFPYDTLTSSQTGEQFYIDSMHHEYYDFQYGSRQLLLDASLIFRLQGDRRWSLFGGIGMSVGFSYESFTELTYGEWNFGGRSVNQGFDSNGSRLFERYDHKSGVSASVYLPLGIDFRIGKNREFWKPIHLFLETRPGFQLNDIPGNGLRMTVGSTGGLGLRVSL